MKKERHQLIRQIIEVQNIETQEDLARALLEHGYNVTQATVSRDIKEMMLVKVPNVRGGYSYAFPKERTHVLTPEKLERTLRDSVVNVRMGGNLVVLHTMPGTAQGVAFVIDSMKWPGVLGTVAGDDTIFTAMDQPESAPEFIRYLGLEVSVPRAGRTGPVEAESAPVKKRRISKKAGGKKGQKD